MSDKEAALKVIADLSSKLRRLGAVVKALEEEYEVTPGTGTRLSEPPLPTVHSDAGSNGAAPVGTREDQIRAYLTEHGPASRGKIAQDTGISQTQLCRVISGERGLSIDALETLADYLELEIVMRPKRRRKGR